MWVTIGLICLLSLAMFVVGLAIGVVQVDKYYQKTVLPQERQKFYERGGMMGSIVGRMMVSKEWFYVTGFTEQTLKDKAKEIATQNGWTAQNYLGVTGNAMEFIPPGGLIRRAGIINGGESV